MPGEAPGLVAFAIDQVAYAVRAHAPRVALDPIHLATVGGTASRP